MRTAAAPDPRARASRRTREGGPSGRGRRASTWPAPLATSFEIRMPTNCHPQHARHRLHAVVGDRRQPGARARRSAAIVQAREYLDGAHPARARHRTGPRPARAFLAAILRTVSERYVVTPARAGSRRGSPRWSRSGDCGAVATFVGLVRDHNAGRRVLWLDYEAYAPLAVSNAFAQIGDEAAARWPSARARDSPPHRPGRDRRGERGRSPRRRRIAPTPSPRAATRSSA